MVVSPSGEHHGGLSFSSDGEHASRGEKQANKPGSPLRLGYGGFHEAAAARQRESGQPLRFPAAGTSQRVVRGPRACVHI